jgi:short-subunit dehydrogenase
MTIKDKIIIITGATQGIGLATARLLAEKGATIVLASRSEEDLHTLEKEIPGSLAVPTDMRKPEDVRNLINKTVEKYGRIDVLINNAGQGMYGPLESIDIEKYKQIMDLNVYGVLVAMQAVIPVMRKQGGGTILNVSSLVSKNYFPGLSAYASTKYALNALSLTARVELAKDNIIVSVMHPKMTATNFTKNTANPTAPRFERPAGAPPMQVDKSEAVAEKIAELIESEVPEAEM